MKNTLKNCMVVAMVTVVSMANAQDAVGTVKSVRGDVRIERQGRALLAKAGDAVQPRDRIVTGVDSGAGIGFVDQSSIAVGAKSDVDLTRYSFNGTTHQGEQQVRVRSGSMASISGKIAKASPETVQFNAGTVTLGVRGTRFVIEAQPAAQANVAYYWMAGGQVLRSGTGECVGTSSAPASPVRSDCLPDRFVLLPDADGQVGRIVLQSGSQTITVGEAYAGAVQGSGALEPAVQTAAEVQARYGQLLSTLPPKGKTFQLRFASGSATELSQDSQQELARLKAEVARWPVAADLSVVGHTDTVGSAAQNDKLSLERANTVRKVLVDAGLPAERVYAYGRGERELLVATPDETPNALNRRVEVTLY